MPKTRNKLSYKEDRFIDLYLLNKGNGTEAAFEAYNCVDRDSAASIAWNLLRNARIIGEIEERRRLLPENVTESVILINMARLALTSKNENIQTKNLELLAKCKNLMIDKVPTGPIDGVVSSQIDVNKVSTADLIDILQNRLRVSSKGVNTSQASPKDGPQSSKDAIRDTIPAQVESGIAQAPEQGKP
jgi:hypothetical protein